jgi:hypothetical protein
MSEGIRDGRNAAEFLRIEIARTGRADLQRALDWISNVLNQVSRGGGLV